MLNHKIIGVFLMSDHNKLSKSEEMYLVTIRQICEHCDDTSIPIPDIAAALDVQPVSVNQMVKKLAEAGWVEYIPYKGVELTEAGRTISTRVLRHRRLWEVFLVKALKMDLNEADELACQLEHTTSVDVANRLSRFLDDPTVCFHGMPIYPSEEDASHDPDIILSAVKVGRPFHFVRIEGDDTLRGFLADQGVYPGNRGSVLAANGSGTLLVEAGTDSRVTVTQEIAEFIFIEEQHV